MLDKYPFSKNEFCCHKISLNFLDSCWEIFGPLISNTTLMIIEKEEMVIDLEKFLNILHKKQVTRLILVPSLLSYILNYLRDNFGGHKTKLNNVQKWFVGGEALSNKINIDFYRHFSRVY